MNKNNNDTIFIDKTILKNPLLTFPGFCVYVALRKIQNKEPTINITLNYLYYTLTHKNSSVNNHYDNINRNTKDFLKKGLLELINLNLVTLIQKDKYENNFILNLQNIYINIKTGNFITITNDDLINIIQIKPSLTVTSKLLKYYCLIVSYFYKNTRYTTLYLNNLADEINLTRITLFNYNQLLQKAKVLYICKNNTYYNTSTKEMEHIPSIYASYSHKNQAIQFNKYNNLKNNFNKSKIKQTDSSIGNKHRSVSMKYNRFCKDTTVYTPIEVLTLYQQVIERNNDFIQASSIEQATPFLKSLDPFIKYFEPYKLIAQTLNINYETVIQTLHDKKIKITDLFAINNFYGSNIKCLLENYFTKIKTKEQNKLISFPNLKENIL